MTGRSAPLFIQIWGTSQRSGVFPNGLLPETWTKLVRLSQGLFIWISTVCSFIEHGRGHRPQGLLDLILSQESRPQAEAALDTLYLTALSHVFPNNTLSNTMAVRLVLAAVIFSGNWITSLDDLRSFLPREIDVDFVVSSLRCVLTEGAWGVLIPSMIRVIHSSFSDFISDPQRRTDHRFLIEAETANGLLAETCLLRIEDHYLSADGTNSTKADIPISHPVEHREHPVRLAPRVRRNWFNYLARAGKLSPSLSSSLSRFTEGKLEVMVAECTPRYILVGAQEGL
jgi:hypothetical protein